MRIYGNRAIKTLPGDVTRPTTGKVRQALFNIWQHRVDQGRWLDLCAGNGTMGAEALCRGAQSVTAIEQSPIACKIIRQNWEPLASADQQFLILRGSVIKKLATLQSNQYDLIYFDPPYQGGLYQPVLELLDRYGLLAPTGELAVEHDPKIWPSPDRVGHMVRDRQKHYGKTTLSFYGWLD
ncbi:MAG: 16S rRNA (guanine(966)-N(2))-methyltransferase RsmD [Synechococcaceae cyanobacterium RL_1_2]|nr:16S rRNA (guanine(966)-N(2))-methyltransferase RsmD [Synechococcaceae cyanobacterium RL_1_2]